MRGRVKIKVAPLPLQIRTKSSRRGFPQFSSQWTTQAPVPFCPDEREYGKLIEYPCVYSSGIPTPLSQTAAVTAPTSSRSWIDILGLGLSPM